MDADALSPVTSKPMRLPASRPLHRPFAPYVTRGIHCRPLLAREGRALICVACRSTAHSPTRIDRLVGSLATLQVWREDIATTLRPTELDALILRLLSVSAVIECIEAVDPAEISGRIGDSAMFEHWNAWTLGGGGRIEATARALLGDRSFKPVGHPVTAAIERATQGVREAAARHGFAHWPGQYECGCLAAVLPKVAHEAPSAPKQHAVVNAPDPWRVSRGPAVVEPIAMLGSGPARIVVPRDGWDVPHEVESTHRRICRPEQRQTLAMIERRRLRVIVLTIAILHRGVRHGVPLVKLPQDIGEPLTFAKRAL